MGNFSILSDILTDAGPKTGQFAAKFQCQIVEADGRTCGKTRVIYHKRGRAVSTTNLINHVRERAAVCCVHKEALTKIEAASTNFIEIDGETVPLHSFREAFNHHVDLMWLECIGLSQKMTARDELREYVRGYEPRAAFPDKATIHKLVDAVHELQTKRREQKIAVKKKVFKGQQFAGIQIDMWWDTDTQTAFGCISMTTVEDPESLSPSAQMWLASELLAFEVFPFHAKTGELIRTWVVSVFAKYDLDHLNVAGVCPDGAADGQCAFKLISTLAEKVDTCQLHILQRAVLNSVGLAGTTSKNPLAKKMLKKNNRIVMLSRQSGSFGKSLASRSLWDARSSKRSCKRVASIFAHLTHGSCNASCPSRCRRARISAHRSLHWPRRCTRKCCARLLRSPRPFRHAPLLRALQRSPGWRPEACCFEARRVWRPTSHLRRCKVRQRLMSTTRSWTRCAALLDRLLDVEWVMQFLLA